MKNHVSKEQASLTKEIITVNEVSNLLSLGKSTVYDLVDKQLIPHYRVTGSSIIRFRQSEIVEWWENQHITPNTIN